MACGHCHKTWNDEETPTPSARCPYEYEHENDEETNDMSQQFWTRDNLQDEYGHRWDYVNGVRSCAECGTGGDWWDDSTEVFSPCPSSYFENDDMQNTADLSDWKYFDDMLDAHNGNMYRNETNQLPERFNPHSTHELRSWLANKIVHHSIYGNENN